jgi:hypothetical protein
MKAVSHEVSHYYQPSNTSCSPTALSILLSYFGDDIKPLDVEQEVPQSVNENR